MVRFLVVTWVPATRARDSREGLKLYTISGRWLKFSPLPYINFYQSERAAYVKLELRLDGRSVLKRLRILALILIIAAAVPARADDELAAQAYAILQTRCLECHGLEKKRGDLRLDSRDAVLKGGESGEPSLVAGNADDSALFYRVTTDDEKERMPSKADPLPAAEIAVLKAWIEAGAPWPKNAPPPADAMPHWAFQPPVEAALPQVKHANAVANDIDRFLVAAMEKAGLDPAPEADKYTLIRRAYLELVGLPPSPEEVEEFAKDRSKDAYERLVDRLLELPHYGERQARRWLDAARYADTNGYEKDRPRSIWPYRDWVINAFNANMPYNEFIVEQVAGDLLPNATESQKVATGFHRNSMFNEEGGIDAAEDWYKRTVDRANTTANVFLGLTLQCAQCHNHKYDPISQKEYFGFAAFINDSGEEKLSLHDAKVEAARAEALDTIAKAEEDLVQSVAKDPGIQAQFNAWMNETRAHCIDWQIVTPAAVGAESSATLRPLDDGSVLATGDVPNDDTYTIDLAPGDAPVAALRLEVLPDESLPGGGPGRGEILADGDFLLTHVRAELITASGTTPIEIASATQDFAAKDNEASKALDGSADTGWSIKGGTGKPHAAVFQFAKPVDARDATLRVVLEQDFIHQHVIGRFRVSVASPHDATSSGVPAEVEAALLKSAEARAPYEQALLARYYALEVAPAFENERKKLTKARGELPKLPTTLVMTPRDPSRPTYLYNRGEFLQPRDEVGKGVPAILPPLPEKAPLNRLTLARWIADEKNPLTARVAVNRLWQQVFGRGLVGTVEDFGTRGDKPTNPELLDWLATEFVRSGWDYKHMHRLFVTSAAFRRSADVTLQALEKDPENLLLARGPRLRLEAETIRDLALTASGLLNNRIGGPSVYPPQPVGVSEVAYDGARWPTSSGKDRYRRGLYTYMKRTTPYAAGITFDAPSGEELCPRRERTTTPLQALTLLNDQVYLEASQALAKRVMDTRKSDRDRIDYLFQLCLSREPDAQERARIEEFLHATNKSLESDAPRARQISGSIGLFSAAPPPELAAWTAVCRAILNLDETITRG